jgi:hypothetical protein
MSASGLRNESISSALYNEGVNLSRRVAARRLRLGRYRAGVEGRMWDAGSPREGYGGTCLVRASFVGGYGARRAQSDG